MGDSRSPSPRRERDPGVKGRDGSGRRHREARNRDHDRERDHERDRRDRRRSRSRDRDHKDRDRHRDRDRRDRDRDRTRRETSEERRERKRTRKEKGERRDRERRERKGRKQEEGDEWVEKGPEEAASEVEEKGERAAGGSGRDWMGGDDLFTGFGIEHKRKEDIVRRPIPGMLADIQEPPKPTHSKYELNKQLLEGKTVDEYESEGELSSPFAKLILREEVRPRRPRLSVAHDEAATPARASGGAGSICRGHCSGALCLDGGVRASP